MKTLIVVATSYFLIVSGFNAIESKINSAEQTLDTTNKIEAVYTQYSK